MCRTCHTVSQCNQVYRRSTALDLGGHHNGKQSSVVQRGRGRVCTHRDLGCRRNLLHSHRNGGRQYCPHNPAHKNEFIMISSFYVRELFSHIFQSDL